MNDNENNKKYVRISIYALLVVLFSTLIIMFLLSARDFFVNKQYTGIFKVLTPFIVGIIIAYLLNPLLNFNEKKIFRKIKKTKLKRTLSILTTYIIAIIVISLLMLMVIPQVGASLKQLASIVTDLFSPANSISEIIAEEDIADIADIKIDENNIMNSKIGVMINDSSIKIQEFIDNLGLDFDIRESFNELILSLTANLASLTQNIVQPIINQTAVVIYSMATGIINVFIAIILSVYSLANKDILNAQAKKILFALFPSNFTAKLIQIARDTDKIVGGFITGKMLDSLIIGILCFICMSLFNINYPMLISVIVCVTNVIPFFGPFIGAIPSIFFLLFAEPWQALWFIVFILILQQLDGNIIGPKIIGSTIGLSSFWVIFAIILMNGLFGIVGMFFGVPIFAVIYYLAKEFIENRLKNKNLPPETVDYIEETAIIKNENTESSRSIISGIDNFAKKITGAIIRETSITTKKSYRKKYKISDQDEKNEEDEK